MFLDITWAIGYESQWSMTDLINNLLCNLERVNTAIMNFQLEILITRESGVRKRVRMRVSERGQREEI